MRYLAVDLGNVICEVKFDNFNKELSKTLNLSIEDVNYFLHRTSNLHDLGITRISDELINHYNIKSPVIIDNLVDKWNEVIVGHGRMLEFLEELLAEPIKIALLSNIGIDHALLMKNILGETIYNKSIRFFSCDVGARKPSFLYYKTFLDMNPEFKGCLYLDDKIENVEAGNKFGFNAKQFILDQFGTITVLENKLTELESLI